MTVTLAVKSLIVEAQEIHGGMTWVFYFIKELLSSALVIAEDFIRTLPTIFSDWQAGLPAAFGNRQAGNDGAEPVMGVAKNNFQEKGRVP